MNQEVFGAFVLDHWYNQIRIVSLSCWWTEALAGIHELRLRVMRVDQKHVPITNSRLY
jgi:hypothetical protein